jgi:hypothetical protein
MDEFYNKFCIDILFKNISEIKALQEPLKSRLQYIIINELGAHIYYEDILCPFFLSLLEDETKDSKKIIEKIVLLIEELVKHDDFEVRCVAYVSFIEPLLDKIQPTQSIEKYLLPKSLEKARHIAKDQFGMNPKTWKKE